MLNTLNTLARKHVIPLRVKLITLALSAIMATGGYLYLAGWQAGNNYSADMAFQSYVDIAKRMKAPAKAKAAKRVDIFSAVDKE